MRKTFIPLCKKSTDRYHFNILRIITLIYHMYIEYELYNLAENITPGFLYEHKFIIASMGKFDDHYTFIKIFRNRVSCLNKNCEKLMITYFVNKY